MEITKDKEAGFEPQEPSSLSALATLILAFLLFVGVFFFIKNDSFSLLMDKSSISATAEKETSLYYDLKDKPIVGLLGSTVLYCTREEIRGFSPDGEELWKIPIEIKNEPVLKPSGKYVLVADGGGNNLYIIENGKLKWKKTLDNAIITVSIREEGTVIVTREDKSYRGVVSVFDKAGREIFTYRLAYNFPICSDVSPDGKWLAIGALAATEVRTKSVLYFIDQNGECSREVPIEDCLIIGVQYLKGGNLLVTTNSSLILFDNAGNQVWTRGFADGSFLAKDISDGKLIGFASKVDASSLASAKSLVQAVDTEGKLKMESEVEGQVKSISFLDGVVAVNLGREVLVSNDGNKVIFRYSPKEEIKLIKLFPDGMHMLVQAGGRLLVVKYR